MVQFPCSCQIKLISILHMLVCKRHIHKI